MGLAKIGITPISVSLVIIAVAIIATLTIVFSIAKTRDCQTQV